MRLPSQPLRLWLVLSHGLVLVLPVLAVLGTGLLRHALWDQTRADLHHQGALVALLVEHALTSARATAPAASLDDLGPALGPLLVRAREQTLAGVRVVDHTGRVVASSGDELGEDLSDRPEVAAAIAGAVGLDVRPRPPPTRNALDGPSRRAEVRLFLGVPVLHGGQTVGAVVLSRTPREEVQALYQAVPWWAVAGPLLLTLLVALTASRVFSRSLVGLAEVAGRVADGDLEAIEALHTPATSRVAEVRGLTDAFATMTRRLRERLAYISEFAGHVSHEFKTPIATLRGTVELLRDDPDMPPAQRDRFLDNALAELRRLERLVTGLLSLARAEEGAARAPVDLDALVAALPDRFGDVELVGRAGVVPGSRAQLEAAIDNLVDNALRYGGDDVRVRVELSRDGDVAVIAVRDDGPGIGAANLPHVFERFFTTARDRGGTGLGLALVRAVARAHGGDVEARSRPGDTVFEVRLPGRRGPS